MLGVVVVNGAQLAHELRRRRVGRADMVATLDGVNRSTWLPAAPADVPTSLLVLAALSLSRAERGGARAAL